MAISTDNNTYMSTPPFDEKEYSLESSRKLAEWSPGGFRDESEALYRTEKGNYFILFTEGMLSRHRNRRGEGEWYGGSFIRPITPLRPMHGARRKTATR